VENAVTHGIAELVEGGEVRIEVQRHGERLALTVSNPFDAQGEPRAGEGLGLANVRARLVACYGSEAILHVQRSADTFSVTLELPREALPATVH
jgi:two-component system sensor histidine kinase AlgZ